MDRDLPRQLRTIQGEILRTVDAEEGEEYLGNVLTQLRAWHPELDPEEFVDVASRAIARMVKAEWIQVLRLDAEHDGNGDLSAAIKQLYHLDSYGVWMMRGVAREQLSEHEPVVHMTQKGRDALIR